jgi:hypothetical protein
MYPPNLFYFYYTGENEGYGGRTVKGVGVMKDKDLKFEEAEVFK